MPSTEGAGVIPVSVLMALYNGTAIISLGRVSADYFTHLMPLISQRKVLPGKIELPITDLN
ncbi:pyocin activator PrtN family protein [Pseudomonas sp. xss_1]|uniref:pyocin activator PrtN family protein n=1 Tax=Pseudomonas sp. xss_1 TaxID=3367214 RepID=UPI003709F749